MNLRLLSSLCLATAVALTGCSMFSSKPPPVSATGPIRATEDGADFVVTAVKLRHQDYAAGALAMTHATTPELRTYGAELTRNQTFLLNDLTALATTLRIPIPSALDEAAEAPLENLVDQQGADFDRRFIGMMATNHARDLRAFQQALGFERDPVIRAFAERRIGLIQSQFDDIKAIQQPH